MIKKDFDIILNQWKIYDENERWSFKSLFLQNRIEEIATRSQFSEFLSRQLGKKTPKGSPIL